MPLADLYSRLISGSGSAAANAEEPLLGCKSGRIYWCIVFLNWVRTQGSHEPDEVTLEI